MVVWFALAMVAVIVGVVMNRRKARTPGYSLDPDRAREVVPGAHCCTSHGGSGGTSDTYRWILIGPTLVVIVSSVARIVSLDGPELAGRYTADDAFYYMVIAEHFPVPSFADGILTTGFHPLWWFLLAPIEALTSGVNALRAMLVTTVALHIASAFTLGALFRRWWGRDWVAPIATTFWIVHPGIRSIAMIGVEAGLVALCLALLMVAVSAPHEPHSPVLVGALAGLSFLARSDSLLVVVPIVFSWIVASDRKLRATAWSACMAIAVAAPWLLYLVSREGLRQDSADALRVVRKGLGSYQSTTEALLPFADRFVELGILGWNADVPGPRLIILVPALFLVALYPPRPAELGLATGVVIVHVAQAMQLGAMREWYSVYTLVAIAVLFFPRLVRAAADLLRRWSAVLPGVALPVMAGVMIVGAIQMPASFPQEEDKYNAAVAVGDALAPSERLGAFNAGIYQWVMRQEVLNLDGVVNPDVLSHLRDRSVCDYVDAKRIDWIIDSRNGERKADVFAPGLLHERRDIDIPIVADAQYLWRVDGNGCR